MATYEIIAKDAPAGPGQINAGATITPAEGDVFIFRGTADDKTTFSSPTGDTTAFEIRFEESSSAGGYTVEIASDLQPSFVVEARVDISDVDLDAKNADQTTLTLEADSRIGTVEGSDFGSDTVILGNDSETRSLLLGNGANSVAAGDRVTVDGDLTTGNASDSISFGHDALVTGKITTGDGADVVSFGDRAELQDDIDTGSGDDSFTAGHEAYLEKGLQTRSGADSVTIGNNAQSLYTIDTGDGADAINLGSDGTYSGDIRAGNGNDEITIGDGNVFDKIEGGSGSNSVRVGNRNTFEAIQDGSGASTYRVGLFDPSVPQVIDGEGHTGGDGDPTNDDTLHVAIGDKTAFEAELLSEGYVFDAGVWRAGGSGHHLHYGQVDIYDWENIRIVCFASGTRILTPDGERPIETLAPGDTVCTMDNGVQTIRWAGCRTVPAIGALAPVCIAENAYGNDRPLLVSPQHRMLLSGVDADILFGEPEVLVPAKMLIDGTRVRRAEGGWVTYHHILFDSHQIVFAEGSPSESFHPGDYGLTALDPDALAELLAVFPDLEDTPARYGAAARLSLKAHEARLILAERAA